MPPTPTRAGVVITNEFNLFHVGIILGLVSELACFWSLSGQPPALEGNLEETYSK